MHIVDRRLNPSGKNLANRQRFMRRAKSLIRKAVHESSASRSIKDADQAGEVALPAQGMHEPSFHRSAHAAACATTCCPATRSTSTATRSRARRAAPAAAAPRAARTARARTISASRCRATSSSICSSKTSNCPISRSAAWSDTESVSWHRAGYSVTGSPANLALLRTMRNSLSRRIALKRPKPDELAAAARRDRRAQPGRRRAARAASSWKRSSTRKLRRTGLIPYIDPLDVRYRMFEPQPKPVAQAVMFCLMDVSGSMTEHMKDLAKRFYMLLYIFLKRRYKHVDVVFIRHTHQAQEVDEETFFHSPRDRRHGGLDRARGDAARRRASATARTRGTSTPRRPRTATTPRPTTTRPRHC